MEMNNFKEVTKALNDILKEKGFKKKGNTWNRKISAKVIDVINLQKESIGKENSITLNIGLYISGTEELMFDKTLSFAQEYNCLFVERPRYFGLTNDWLSLDSHNFTESIENIQQLLQDRILNFFEAHTSIEEIMKLLPLNKWLGNINWAEKIIRFACLQIAFNDIQYAKSLLKSNFLASSIWKDCANKIINKIEE
jgi:uncharacterized protein DUF4304